MLFYCTKQFNEQANAAFLPIAGIKTNFANETNPNYQYDTLTNED